MKIPCLAFSLVLVGLHGSLQITRGASDAVSPKIVLQSIRQLEEQLRSATDARTKEKTGQRILQVGSPLLSGEMAPGKAGEVAPAMTPGGNPTADQRAYFAFWLVRAMGAIAADDEEAGTQASSVLKTLGALKADNQAVINVMAALNVKGWLVFVNSLGMKFMPVAGTKVLFSVWETRVRDYAAFAQATGRAVEKPDFEQGPTHPVVKVSWEDAQAFCKWLSSKEGRSYRLPTDEEWSVAVGLGKESGRTPAEKEGKSSEETYPWGAWPPREGTGNFGFLLKVDRFEYTAPVGRFKPNSFGLYDLSGNVLEWCEDWFDSDKNSRVLRGGSWGMVNEVNLRSSYRWLDGPARRVDNVGFRCVVVGSGG